MAYISPAFANQNASPGYGAAQTRNAVFCEFAGNGGVIGLSDWLVTAGGGMSVSSAAGRGLIPGTNGGQGLYLCQSVTSNSLTILTSDPSNPRIDTVIALVTDSEYSGITDTWSMAVVEGTPTSGANLTNLNGRGSVTGNAIVIAYVLVPASASSIVSGDILDFRSWAYIANQQLPFTNGYGITGFGATGYTIMSPAVDLTYSAAAITAPVSLASNTQTKVFDTASLGIGTWDVSMFAVCQSGGTVGEFEAEAVVDTATATLYGIKGAATQTDALNLQAHLSMRFIAVITGAGTLKLIIDGTGATSNTALASTVNESYTNITGYVAVRIA